MVWGLGVGVYGGYALGSTDFGHTIPGVGRLHSEGLGGGVVMAFASLAWRVSV